MKIKTELIIRKPDDSGWDDMFYFEGAIPNLSIGALLDIGTSYYKVLFIQTQLKSTGITQIVAIKKLRDKNEDI